MKKHFLKLVIAVCALTGASPAQAQSIYEPYSFTTLAGLALNSGATDDTGSLARFNQPWGVAVDSAGNVYVAEALNQTIRKITPGGVVTTLAGVAGSPGFNDGPANAALFSRPTGVAVNSAGTVVYVADRNNHIIRKISGGFVTTLAGSAGVFGSADGTGPAAQFHYPNGVAVDSADNVYVADTFNETIRKITPGGGVTTLAGSVGVFGSANGPGTAAQFGAPEGIAVDESGNVYVADIASATIRKIAFNGWVSTLAGSAGSSGFTDGVGSAARFSMAELTIVTGVPGVAVDSCGNVYVADGGNDLIRKITPGGSVTTLGGLALTSGSNDDTGSAARFYFPAGVAVDGAGNVYVADTLNHTIRLGVNTNTNASPNCDTNTSNCPEGAPLDANGNLVVPEGMDTNLITYVEVNRLLGTVEQLNPGFDTSVDLWYTNLNCLQSIGGTVPTNASNPDFTSILAGIGITNVSPAQISITISNWNVQIASQAVSETLSFPTAGPVGPPYFPPATPHCPDPTKKYAFGGRDIVFVHGLQLGHVFDKIAGNPHAMQTWVTPTQFPGSAQNPEFYDGGYFKSVADDVWYVHLIKFLLMNGYQNRYLIVDYPCTERLEVGAQAVLTQISDAMHFGTGVKSIGQLLDPNGAYDTSNFGTPSFVVVSHSTGTLLTDVAMTAAARYPNLGAGYIPQMCKAHVAMDGVFSGSELATAAIAISGFATVSPADWGCSMAAAALSLFDPSYPAVDCNFLSVFSSSILVDLVPLVSQYKWGSFVDATPVRTLTLVGGHPTFLWPLKYLINPGFDDGVTTINSQVANPNSRFFWPSGFRPQGSGLIGPFDMGLAGTGNGQQSGLMSPARAVGYYIDQVAEPGRLPPLLIAGGATPYLSPSGMRQDVADDYAGTPFSTLNRYHNHFSFIQSASDHLGGYTGTLGFFGSDYFPTPIGEANQEESRVITDPAVYVPFSMVYPGDDAPLLDRSCVPKVESWERGRMIPAIHFSFFGHHYTWGPWWIWRRVYDLLEGWQTKMGCDYMYESVLQCPPLQSCATCIAPPANLALWLPFDEASGSTARNLAGGSDGVLYNGSTVATSANGPIHEVSDPTHITPTGGFNGGSLYFDGIDDNVVVPSYNGINVGAGDFTLGAWVNRDPNSGASSIRVIVDKREPGTGIGYSFVVDSGNLLLQMTSTAGNFANYSDTNAVPVDNQWHFVAVTVSRGPTNSVVRFYLDGAPTAILNTAALPGSLDNTTPLQVGSSLVPGVDAWMGGIDEVVLFTRALTALEIQGLSNAGSVGQCKTPLLSSLVLNCATGKVVPCGTPWSFDAPTASDTCSPTNVTIIILSTETNGVCPQFITRTWMATDACTNSATCSQTVMVVDTAPPVLTCATNKTVNCGTAWTFDAPTASDSCSGTNVTLTILSTVTNGVCPQLITRTWMATDACTNSVTCAQTVTVVNTSLPVILCPSNIVVASCTVTQLFYTATATDACNGNLTVVCTPPSGSAFAPGTTNTVTCVASNCIGSASCSFTITVGCSTNPCPNLVVNGSFEATSPAMSPNTFNNALNPTTGVPGWTTASTNFLEIWCNNAGFPASRGTNQLEINAQSDDETVSQVVTGLSTNCAATFCFDYTGRFGLAGGTPNNDFTVTLSSGDILFSVPLDPAASATGGWMSFCTNFVPTASTVTIAFRGHPHFSDGTSATQGGAHIDNVSLTQCCDTNPCITLTCSSDKTVQCGSAWDFDAPTNIVDNCCTNYSVTFSTVTNGLCPLVITRTWLISDICGNSNTCSQVVTVVDTTPPVITCASNKIVECGTMWSFDLPAAVDACSGTNVTLTILSTVTNGLCPLVITQTWQASDTCGNSATCSQTVTVNPAGQCVAGETWTPRQSIHDAPSVASSADGTKLVAADSQGQIYTSTDSGVNWTPRESYRTWYSVASSADGSKLVAVVNAGQVFTSIDSGTNWTAQASGSRNWQAVASSADGSKLVAVVGGGLIYTSIDSGTNWAAQASGSGNWYSVASSSDGSKLVAVVSGGLIFTSIDSGTNWTAQASGSPSWHGVASSSDGSKLVAVAYNDQIYTSTDSGTNWTARESSRNWSGVASSSDGSKLVAVVDGGQVYTSIDSGTNWMARDSNRYWWSVTSSADGSKLVAGVTDSKIYTSACTPTPVITCATDKTVNCGTAWSFDPPTIVNGCSGTNNITLTVLGTVTNGVCPQVITRTWMAMDACTNSTTCSQTVTVVDTTPPVLTCATNKTVNCGTAWTFDAPTANDSCSGTKVTLTVLSTVTNGVCPQVITRTWMATDACSNTATCSQTVTVVDTTPPVLTCATNKTVNCSTPWTFDAPTASDSCSGTKVTITILSTVTNGICPMVITRTWQATDACSNTATCSQTVTVVNTSSPVILCPSNIVVTSCTVTQLFYTATATDACNGNLAVVCTPPSGSDFTPGTTTTVLCVASNCIGSAKCSFTVTVQCPANPCVPAPANMVLWLPFDETSGTNSANLVPGGNNGTQVNGPVVTSGFVANSLTFDGVSQYVEVPSYNAINFGTNDFSIDAWVRRATTSGNSPPRIIVDKRDPQTIIGYSLA
ncbi:MAG: LamG-like jellyroll fold domain-containing protein, partial [Verrucomicrobiota bacterium]